MRYLITYTHVVEKNMEAEVEANSMDEAKKKVECGDVVWEETMAENGLSCKDYSVEELD